MKISSSFLLVIAMGLSGLFWELVGSVWWILCAARPTSNLFRIPNRVIPTYSDQLLLLLVLLLYFF